KEIPLVLCTTASRVFMTHRNFFTCNYPSYSIQIWVDNVIDRILQGAESASIITDLFKIIEREEADTIILGCTELSLFSKVLELSNKKIIDPLDILAKKMVEKSFKK